VADAPWNWGRRTLTRILRGDIRSRPSQYPLRPEAREQAQFGALAFRSQTAIERMLDQLEGAHLLEARRLDHGGVVLDITPAGRATLQDPTALQALVAPSETASEPTHEAQETLADVDDALLHKLRAWRQQRAREEAVPLYVVFHDSHLQALAARRPTTLEELADVKGVGPKRLKKYGAALVELIGSHLEGARREDPHEGMPPAP
jgi:superfamily II DNA helicase RecQ